MNGTKIIFVIVGIVALAGCGTAAASPTSSPAAAMSSPASQAAAPAPRCPVAATLAV